MKISKGLFFIASSLLLLGMTNCSSSHNDIAGKYAHEGENEFDYFKDTMKITPTDDGKFDVQIIANWSAAKKDDPERPVNKKAGIWNNHGAGRIRTAILQNSDMTLRITDPLSGEVTILTIDNNKKTIETVSKKGTKSIYHKVSQ